MYTSEARFGRDRNVFLALLVTQGAFAIVAMITADIVWSIPTIVAVVAMLVSMPRLMRCDRCGKSVLWWALTKARSADFWRVASTTEACPYCGFDSAPR